MIGEIQSLLKKLGEFLIAVVLAFACWFQKVSCDTASRCNLSY